MITLIISHEEIHDITKIVKSLEESALLIKGVSETLLSIKKILLSALGSTLLGNLSTGKGKIGAGEVTVRVGQYF